MLEDNVESINAFREKQHLAFEAERQRWVDTGMIGGNDDDNEDEAQAPVLLENGIEATIAGNIWKIPVRERQSVEEGDIVAILESMKMEFTIKSDRSGIVKNIVKKTGQFVDKGDCIMVIE